MISGPVIWLIAAVSILLSASDPACTHLQCASTTLLPVDAEVFDGFLADLQSRLRPPVPTYLLTVSME